MSDQLDAARRLQQMGVVVRSVELEEEAKALEHFRKNGNRAMRRAAKKRKGKK